MERQPAQTEESPAAPMMLFSEVARPFRFLVTGGLSGLTGLILLYFLTNGGGVPPFPAWVLAFLLAAQLNFTLSQFFTWRDRRPSERARRRLLGRWLAFHGSISATATLNMAIFAFSHLVLPDLVAAGLGIGVAGLINFAAGDRLIFRRPSRPSPPEVHVAPAVRAERPLLSPEAMEGVEG
jgi:putative flippase GtrA